MQNNKPNLQTEQFKQSQHLEAIGQLAAGIAHEINTPTQYVGDNIHFLKGAFADLKQLIGEYDKLAEETKENPLYSKIQELKKSLDIDFLLDDIPNAIEQSLEGVGRVSKIVQSMKEFSHPPTTNTIPIDINKAIDSTITISRNEWKYVADMETDFDSDLPMVQCFPGEFNQVILNLIVNAAHAIDDMNSDSAKGKITISTKSNGDFVEIRVADTGVGIPKKIQSKIFIPFFTTKGVGKGTGQGLSISYSVIVDKHKGSLSFETEEGKGTVFIIRLPLNQ